MAAGNPEAQGRGSQGPFAAVRYVLIGILTVAAVALNVCAHKFMGMNRQVKFMYRQLEGAFSPDLVFWEALALVLVALAAAAVVWLRSPGRDRRAAVAALLVAVAAAVFASVLAILGVQGAQGLASYASKPAGFYARVLVLPVADVAALLASVNAALVARRFAPISRARPAADEIIPTTPPADGETARAARPAKNEEALMTHPTDDERVRRTRRVARVLTVAVLAAIVLVCVAVPSVRAGISRVFTLLSSGDVNAVIELIRSYGPWAAAISCALMILQSLAAPIPAFLITFANAAIFGWALGAALSWSSAMLGAAICFGIARVLGRDAVAHFATRGALETVDQFFERYGKNTILVCRLLPFVSFDLVSYAAGLTGMGFWGFLAATGVGQLPATLVYSYVGGMLTGGTKAFVTALLIIFALGALGMLARQVYVNRRSDPATSGATGEQAVAAAAEPAGAEGPAAGPAAGPAGGHKADDGQ